MTASKIEWTDRSDWNPVRGCTRVSPGCGGPGDHGGCYAEGMAARFSKPGQWGHGFAEMKSGRPRWTGKVAVAEDRVTLPLRWRKPAKVFVSSTSDVFHEALRDEAIDRIFAVMALCPHLTFQILTKRPDRMRDYMSPYSSRRADSLGTKVVALGYQEPLEHLRWPLPNVWLGTSVENRGVIGRIDELRATAAAVRFISFEPLLGTLGNIDFSGIHWAIVGGESGPRARPTHPDWVRSLRDQCLAAKVPFLFKQWGEWAPCEKVRCSEGHDHRVNQLPAGFRFDDARRYQIMDGEGIEWAKVGKKDAGRELDGAVWSEFPAAT
ncbi:MAG TPA: phage Gp37/Gp68 family protein [Rhizomicrobium sp.]|jgi:protein gp37